MAEIWDAYDRQFNRIENTKLIRGESIPDGIYHLVGEIIVRHKDGTFLLMQRDFNKHLGGMWELTAGGSALEGETPLECAIRELKEAIVLQPGETIAYKWVDRETLLNIEKDQLASARAIAIVKDLNI